MHIVHAKSPSAIENLKEQVKNAAALEKWGIFKMLPTYAQTHIKNSHHIHTVGCSLVLWSLSTALKFSPSGGDLITDYPPMEGRRLEHLLRNPCSVTVTL